MDEPQKSSTEQVDDDPLQENAKEAVTLESLKDEYLKICVVVPQRPARITSKEEREIYEQECEAAKRKAKKQFSAWITIIGQLARTEELVQEEALEAIDFAMSTPVEGLGLSSQIEILQMAVQSWSGIDHWLAHLQCGKEGQILADLANITIILANDANWEGKLKYNQLSRIQTS